MIKATVNAILGSRCVCCNTNTDLFVVSIQQHGNLLSDVERAKEILKEPTSARIKYVLVCGGCAIKTNNFDLWWEVHREHYIYG